MAYGLRTGEGRTGEPGQGRTEQGVAHKAGSCRNTTADMANSTGQDKLGHSTTDKRKAKQGRAPQAWQAELATFMQQTKKWSKAHRGRIGLIAVPEVELLSCRAFTHRASSAGPRA